MNGLNLDLSEFTQTHMAILKLLSDGQLHTREELQGCLPDALSTSINVHLVNMRKALRPQGQTIHCVVRQRKLFYCWVQLCPPAYQALMEGRYKKLAGDLGDTVCSF